MKLKITITILFFIGLKTIAQTKYEKGYIIKNNGVKLNVLIKNEDWIDKPNSVEFKESENSKVKIISGKQIKELVIPNKLVFERHEVDIDKYSKDLNKLSYTRFSNFKKESLLLKLILDGKTKLFRYSFNSVQHYYYQKSKEVKPLEYKVYLTKNNTVGKNLNYRKTLREELSCIENKINNNISYSEKKLIKYFTQYNSCNNSTSKIFSNEVKKGNFNVTPKISFGQSKVSKLNSSNPDAKFDEKLILKFGVEFEYIFPFNNNKWSVFLEPTYQFFKSTSNSKIGGAFVPSSGLSLGENNINYSSIEIPIGLRHYFFINDNNMIFVNAGINFDQVINDELNFTGQTPLVINTTTNYLLGIGYNLNNKFSIELRYNTPRNITRFNSIISVTNYNNTSLKVGYKLL